MCPYRSERAHGEARAPGCKPAGFTLLEVVVAFAILALILGVVFEAIGGGARNARLAEEYTVATLWAKSTLAAFGVEKDLVAGESQGRLPGPYRWRGRVTAVEESKRISATKEEPRLYDIRLTVEWGDGRHGRSVSLGTQRLAP